MYQIINLSNLHQHQAIHDLVLHPLKVNTDPRGSLTEIMKTTWEDVFHPQTRPFAQVYYSVTHPDTARDIDQWHYHPGGQIDRFGVIAGDIVVALYDNRDDSPTKGTLNLFAMGESNGNQGQYLLLVPPRTYHGYLVVSDKPAIMYNFPTRLYDPQEEKRLPFTRYKLADGSIFQWDKAKKAYNKFIS